jgi:hypothetical protein
VLAERLQKGAVRAGEVGVLNQGIIGNRLLSDSAVEAWLERRPADDLDALGLSLCDTPCSPLKTHWPWLEAELLLTGTVAPGRKPFKFSAHVI